MMSPTNEKNALKNMFNANKILDRMSPQTKVSTAISQKMNTGIN